MFEEFQEFFDHSFCYTWASCHFAQVIGIFTPLQRRTDNRSVAMHGGTYGD